MARAKVTGKDPSRAARSQKLDTLWQFSDPVANLQAMGGAAKEMALRILAALRVMYNQAKENKILRENPADMLILTVI